VICKNSNNNIRQYSLLTMYFFFNFGK
jgi:hypothetical protein